MMPTCKVSTIKALTKITPQLLRGENATINSGISTH
ncbi:Uncharacterised protein [Vibrio cholerae]|nr:Uncharacterised protein [Vibrio cholerae]